MDPFRLCLALGPVAIYLLLLGAINLSRRPFLVTGGRDGAALGLAASGFVLVGPVELFFPDFMAIRLGVLTPFSGPIICVFLLGCYILGMSIVLLLLRPRLVVYNISVDQLRAVLADLVEKLDRDARWAGDSLAMPELGVQLHIEYLPTMRNVSLVSTGPQQSHLGWRRLEIALAAALGEVAVPRNPRGRSLLASGMLIGAMLVAAVALNPQAVAQSLIEMLRL